MSENCAETRPSCRLAPDWKAYRPLLMSTGTAPGNAPRETWSQSRRLGVYFEEFGSQNGNPGLVRRVPPNPLLLIFTGTKPDFKVFAPHKVVQSIA